jgi:hypothetical protein
MSYQLQRTITIMSYQLHRTITIMSYQLQRTITIVSNQLLRSARQQVLSPCSPKLGHNIVRKFESAYNTDDMETKSRAFMKHKQV